jgi:hypothetical protein
MNQKAMMMLETLQRQLRERTNIHEQVESGLREQLQSLGSKSKAFKQDQEILRDKQARQQTQLEELATAKVGRSSNGGGGGDGGAIKRQLAEARALTERHAGEATRKEITEEDRMAIRKQRGAPENRRKSAFMRHIKARTKMQGAMKAMALTGYLSGLAASTKAAVGSSPHISPQSKLRSLASVKESSTENC